MSYYSKLDFSQKNADRVYTIKTVTGNKYEFQKSYANLVVDQEDKMLIFTNKDNYRIALNWEHIESVTYDASAEG